ncbi:ferredoxin-type protein NapF [Magnetovibrio blakemorei]|nr:ferredoxin-type protein NapF [Magnetovibrio blakemorei]
MELGKHFMQVSLSRRAFFSGRGAQPVVAPFRPPWSRAEQHFVDLCTHCNECRDVCAEQIIVLGGGGYPEVDFQNGECSFCGDCAQVCEPGAIVAAHVFEALPWNLGVELSANCLSQNGVMCRVCGERCDARAIRFQLAVGGNALPVIDQSSCTGCGACIAPCPVGALEIKRFENEDQLEELS